MRDDDAMTTEQPTPRTVAGLDLHELYAALDSLTTTVVLDGRDWAAQPDYAWLYGILVGWPEEPTPDESLADVARRHHWSEDRVAQLRAHRAAVAGLTLDAIRDALEDWQDRDNATARGDATMNMANAASAALREQLVAALEVQDDGHTQLSTYIATLVGQRGTWRREVIRLRDQTERLTQEKYRALVGRAAEADTLREALDRVRAVADDIAGGPERHSLLADRIRAALDAPVGEPGWKGVLEAAATALADWSGNYPEDVFPPDSDSQEARAGTVMRHAFQTAADLVRTVLPPKPAPCCGDARSSGGKVHTGGCPNRCDKPVPLRPDFAGIEGGMDTYPCAATKGHPDGQCWAPPGWRIDAAVPAEPSAPAPAEQAPLAVSDHLRFATGRTTADPDSWAGRNGKLPAPRSPLDGNR